MRRCLGRPAGRFRASAEAAAAWERGDHHQAACKHELVRSYQALHDAYRQRETVFAAMADRGCAAESQSPPRDARITVVR